MDFKPLLNLYLIDFNKTKKSITYTKFIKKGLTFV